MMPILFQNKMDSSSTYVGGSFTLSLLLTRSISEISEHQNGLQMHPLNHDWMQM